MRWGEKKLRESKARGSNGRRGQAEGRHRFLYALLRFLLSPWVRRKFHYSYQPVRLKETPAVILVNHNTDWDPLFVGMAVRDFMYFVASEHVRRWGFLSSLLRFVFDPITRVKGTTEARAAMEILKELRRGRNVCIFAEGNRSYNGETGPILPSTGKLVKKSGAALMTYVIRGGYLTMPRWGRGIRRGKLTGELAGEYTAAEIASMSDREINDVIMRDLYVNAFDDQQASGTAYRGKNAAEGIETALYLCPACGGMSTIRSRGGCFFCDCGLSLRYTEYGRMEGANGREAPFKNILEWDRWQAGRLKEMLFESEDMKTPVFCDGGQALFEILSHKTTREVLSGTLSFYRNRLELRGSAGGEPLRFLFSEISDIDVIGRMRITFLMQDGRQYEIRSEHPRAPEKYRTGFRLMTGKGG